MIGIILPPCDYCGEALGPFASTVETDAQPLLPTGDGWQRYIPGPVWAYHDDCKAQTEETDDERPTRRQR